MTVSFFIYMLITAPAQGSALRRQRHSSTNFLLEYRRCVFPPAHGDYGFYYVMCKNLSFLMLVSNASGDLGMVNS